MQAESINSVHTGFEKKVLVKSETESFTSSTYLYKN